MSLHIKNFEDISLSEIGKGWPHYKDIKLPYLDKNDVESAATVKKKTSGNISPFVFLFILFTLLPTKSCSGK